MGPSRYESTFLNHNSFQTIIGKFIVVQAKPYKILETLASEGKSRL